MHGTRIKREKTDGYGMDFLSGTCKIIALLFLFMTQPLFAGDYDDYFEGCFYVEVEPKLIYRKEPTYPEKMWKAGLESKVLIKVLIDTTGNVLKTKLVKKGFADFDSSAMKAAMEWKFSPAKQNGKPLIIPMMIPIAFYLDIDSIRTIEKRTFRLIKGFWIDKAHTFDSELVAIKPESAAYQAVIAQKPELKPYFALDPQVIVNIGKYSIETNFNGKEKLSPDELKKILEEPMKFQVSRKLI